MLIRAHSATEARVLSGMFGISNHNQTCLHLHLVAGSSSPNELIRHPILTHLWWDDWLSLRETNDSRASVKTAVTFKQATKARPHPTDNCGHALVAANEEDSPHFGIEQSGLLNALRRRRQRFVKSPRPQSHPSEAGFLKAAPLHRHHECGKIQTTSLF